MTSDPQIHGCGNPKQSTCAEYADQQPKQRAVTR